MPKLLPVLLVPILAATCLSQQVTVTLTPVRDTTIYANDPTLSNGAGSRCFAGLNLNSQARRALLAFDVAGSIPPGSTINSAQLELTVAQTMAPDLPVSLHRVTSNWGEAGSLAGGGQGGGGPAQTGDATWDRAFFPSTAWQTPGGDFAVAASANVVCGSSGTCTWNTALMVSDVQGWLQSPASSFGWIVITRESGAPTARAFHTREATTASVRPRLVIGYTPPAARVRTIGAGCTGGGAQPLTLTASGAPTVPAPGFSLALSGGPTGAVLAIDVFLDVLGSPLPLGQGCSFWGNPATFIAGVVVPGSLPLPIPNDSALIGRSLAFQGLGVVLATAAFATSNALVLEFGV